MDYRKLVLVGIDRATDVERTMAFALRIAEARGAEVHAIHVVPHRALRVDDPTDLWPFERPGDRRIAARLGSTAESDRHDGVRVRRVTLRGEPADVIPAYAQFYGASVLVVERDYGSSRFWRNGRVVDELAHRSTTPLLVVPERGTSARDEFAPRRILTPVNFSIASAVALRAAVAFARRDGARITVLHTLNDMPRHTTYSGGGAWEVVRRLPAQKDAAARRLRRTAALFGADDVDTEVATGLVHTAILETARRSDPDLIVMGTAHRTWFERVLFGSTLGRVLRRATVPVLVVPVIGGDHTWPDEQLFDPFTSRLQTEPAGERVAA